MAAKADVTKQILQTIAQISRWNSFRVIQTTVSYVVRLTDLLSGINTFTGDLLQEGYSIRMNTSNIGSLTRIVGYVKLLFIEDEKT